MGQVFAINVNIGLKVPHANDVDPEAMAMPHRLRRNVVHVNVMITEIKHSAFVIFKQVNAFANTILKDQTVPNAVKITMEIQCMADNACSNVNRVAC